MTDTQLMIQAVKAMLELAPDYPAFKNAARIARSCVGEPTMTDFQREQLGLAIQQSIMEPGLFKRLIETRQVPYTGPGFVQQRKRYCRKFLNTLRTKQ